MAPPPEQGLALMLGLRAGPMPLLCIADRFQSKRRQRCRCSESPEDRPVASATTPRPSRRFSLSCWKCAVYLTAVLLRLVFPKTLAVRAVTVSARYCCSLTVRFLPTRPNSQAVVCLILPIQGARYGGDFRRGLLAAISPVLLGPKCPV